MEIHEKHSSVSNFVKWGVLAILLIASIIVSVRFGSLSIPVPDILQEFSSYLSTGSSSGSPNSAILWEIRVPRTLFAAFVGGGLSVCGLLLQTITKNELADPYILGVSSGASFGAVGAIIGGWFAFLGDFQITGAAFIGAAISTICVLFMSGRSENPTRLILVGMGISAVFSALTMMLIYSAKHETQVRSAMFWLLGSLSGIQWDDLSVGLFALVFLVIVTFLLRHSLDLLLLGRGEAADLGLNVKRFQLLVVLLSSAVVAVFVAKVGLIGFVGLITPHIARTLFGPRHNFLIPSTALIGALLMIWADIASRALYAPEEIPIGVLTSLAGAPVFLWIISKHYGESES